MEKSQWIVSLNVVFILIAFNGYFACSNETNNNQESGIAQNKSSSVADNNNVFDKLVGTWQNKNGRSYERWTKKDDGTFRSVVFSIRGSDTVWREQADIYPDKDKWVFENTVKGQNDGRAIKFSSTFLTETSVQFSNPAHDFPTDINYSLPDNNTLNAFIVGPNNRGGKDTIPFNYTRVK